MPRRTLPPFRPIAVGPREDKALKEARIGFMRASVFHSHYYISEMKEVFTVDVPTLAANGRQIAINPIYLATLRPGQRIFALAHEVDHNVQRHPQRFTYYAETKGPDGLPFDWQLANISADYVINARLVAAGIGNIHPNWLLHPDYDASWLWEDVYRDIKKKQPNGGAKPPKGNSGSGDDDGAQEGQGGTGGWEVQTAGGKGGVAPPDRAAQANGGRFDDVFSPARDPVSGREDAPSDMDHREAVARAAAAAKGQGTMPIGYQQIVDEILQPQVDWREHIRMTMLGRLGNNSETWTRLNRRRLVLNPPIGLPGRRGYGCDTLVVGFDTSGSIYCDKKLLGVFMGELGGIVDDCRPRQVIVYHCDAKVHQTDIVRHLDEVHLMAKAGMKGGGGTSFVPVFEQVKEDGIVPEMLVYLSDGYGQWPVDAPPYPVLWCLNTDVEPPFGEVVRLHMKGE